MTDSVSVARAAQLTGWSESKVRRRADEGELTEIHGPGPKRLSRESVNNARAKILEELGAVEPGEAAPAVQIQDESEAARLASQVAFLQGALSDLTAAHSAVLDTFRRLGGGIGND